MPWHVNFLSEYGTVETVYSGLLTSSELQAAVDACLSLARAQAAIRFLSDCTALQGGHSVLDLYALLDFLEANLLDGWKEALLLPQFKDSEVLLNVKFWETACLNRGFNVHIFHDRVSALRWLAT